MSYFSSKYLCILLLIGIYYWPQVSAKEINYFEREIIQTQSKSLVQEYLNTSDLKSPALKNNIETTRLAKMDQFLGQIKREANKRRIMGIMNTYELRDFGRETDYLTHNMNEYFRNQSAFEQTRNTAYRTLARQNLQDANMTYERLSAITIASSRR